MTTALPRMRKRTRAERRHDNQQLFWQAKYELASGPDGIAAVAWDRLRSAVEKLPAADQAAAWRQVTERIEQARLELDQDNPP